MKQASECLKSAERCETLAVQARAASSTRILEHVAEQWRKLAKDTERHKRMTWTRSPEPEEQRSAAPDPKE
jgi:hypothetical protein